MSKRCDYYHEGELVNGLPTGKGGTVDVGIFEYLGDFLNGKMHGNGTFKSLVANTTYEGHF